MKVQDKAWASRPPSIAMEIFSYNYRDIVWAPYVFKARVNKAKGNLDCFLQTFPEIKKFKLMQQKIQKKPQAAGTNEEEHADEEQQFDPEVDFVDMLMAHNLVKMGLEISQRIL
ncbi:unnamed protein product [Sphagnum jensenii]|uniref:Uncharacterized protein n=1 Tax=Sphagnum jensenii TaxID=128206 RepID=A0ABP0XL43_9BRYO